VNQNRKKGKTHFLFNKDFSKKTFKVLSTYKEMDKNERVVAA
jgi:hypothetical protein